MKKHAIAVRTAVVLSLAAAAMATFTGEARALPRGLYSVGVCGPHDSGAFADLRVTSAMYVRRLCNLYGRGRRGLVTSSKIRRRRARRGDEASVILRAPSGTALYAIQWSGRAKRADCNWTVELYAGAPRRSRVYVRRLPAFTHCPVHRDAQKAELPTPVSRRLGNRTALVQRVVCRARRCSTSANSYLQTLKATVYLADLRAPSVRILGGGLASRRWARGLQSIRFTAADNVGIADQRLSVDRRASSAESRPCDAARVIQCPNGTDALALDTRRFKDGGHLLTVEVRDTANNARATSTFGLFDNTAPGRIDTLVWPGQTWRRTNSFLVGWRNPFERFAPIAAVYWRRCRSNGASCVTGRRAAVGVASLPNLRVPAPGDWTLQVWRQDAAGNANAGYASAPVHLRFDPDPPRPAFEPQSFSDPTRVSVVAPDGVSGLARGEIELRRRGSSTWQALATRRVGSRLTARIDDARLPVGVYDLRSRAVDVAGNEASTQRRTDGHPMVLTLPLRFPALIRAGVLTTRIVHRTVRRHHRRRRVRRRVARLEPSARAHLGRRLQVRGTLTNPDGQPISGAPLYVYSVSSFGLNTLAGFVTTNGVGAFSYSLSAERNRTLRFYYPGASLIRPTQGDVQVWVPAATTIRASRRRVRNGQSVSFRGRLHTLPAPVGGKLIEMQAHFRGHWRTFSTVRTDSRGRWRFRYRFGGTVGRVRYRFRAVLPAEGGYPFADGRSRVVRVTVRG